MRLQHVLIAMAAFIAVFGLLANMSIDMMGRYGISEADITSDANNISEIITDLDIYDSTNQEMINASQYAPGGSSSQIPDDTQSQSGSLSKSSFQLALEFGGQALSLPKKIIHIVGGFIGVPYELLSLASLYFILVVVFILASAVFFNKL
jgi:hypothetical protein